MNHIPLAVTEPLIQIGETVCRRTAIDGYAMHVRLALEQFLVGSVYPIEMESPMRSTRGSVGSSSIGVNAGFGLS